MSHYSAGRAREHEVRHDLQANGYEVIRSAGSKTKVDLVAFKPGQLLWVQCKSGLAAPSPEERRTLIAAAEMTSGVPIVALRPLRKPIEYRRLTGPGPKEWAPWSPEGGE